MREMHTELQELRKLRNVSQSLQTTAKIDQACQTINFEEMTAEKDKLIKDGSISIAVG